MFNPFEKSIQELQNALADGALTSVQLTEFYLERIREYDSGEHGIRSIICINPNALEQARALDEERSQGKVRGVLHGIPIILKDNIDTADMPTTASCLEMKTSQPAKDAFLLTKLKKAGAFVIAKANLTEFARNGMTVGSLGGQTFNPYDPTRTPGGSSGGTGASIAMNLAAAGLGTDTANSIRSPSSANSLVGFRPTIGLVSRTGLVPCTYKQDTAGPLAKYVIDCAIMLDALRGYDCRDSITVTQLGKTPDTYLSSLKLDGLKGKRIGILTDNMGSDPQVLKVMENAFEVIKNAGAELIEVSAPELATDRVFAECDVQRYETAISMDDYFASVPNCPVKNTKELVAKKTLHPCVSADLEACAEVDDPYVPGLDQQLKNCVRNTEITQKLYQDYNLDALCYPHQQILVVKVDAPGQAKRNGIVASTMGFPAVTVPGGFSDPDENAPIGVPIGIEFMGLPFTEPTLFEIAYAYEQASKNRKPPQIG